MRTAILILSALTTIAVFTSGCAKKQRTYVAPGGSVTVTEKGGGDAKSVEVKTDEGKVTYTTEKKNISEEELGVPVYPGSTVEGSTSYDGAGKSAQESVQQNMLTTTDDFDKVFDFYKSKLKNVENSYSGSMGDGKMGMFTIKSGDGTETHVQISADKEGKLTRIQVIKVKKPQD